MDILIAIGILIFMFLLFCCVRAGALSDQRMQKYNKDMKNKETQQNESQKERIQMQTENTDTRRYARNKPSDCVYCYFWIANKKRCGQQECHYLLHDDVSEATVTQKANEPLSEEVGNCKTCAYGRHSPCIGYCIKKILLETNRKKQDGLIDKI